MMMMRFLVGDAMDYVIKKQGESWSFPEGDPVTGFDAVAGLPDPLSTGRGVWDGVNHRLSHTVDVASVP